MHAIDDGIRDWTEAAEGQVSALTLEGKRKANQDAAADVSGGDKKKNRRSMLDAAFISTTVPAFMYRIIREDFGDGI